MENINCQVSEGKLLQHLGNLRKMMIHHHELEHLTEFVLHDLCSGPCSHINKAAYFANNPDFDILRGVAGYAKQDLQVPVDDVWNNQKKFVSVIHDSRFHQNVRQSNDRSFEIGRSSEKYMVEKLADQLEIANPAYHVWNLKHANYGLLIYEPSMNDLNHIQKNLVDSLYYLSFCSIY